MKGTCVGLHFLHGGQIALQLPHIHPQTHTNRQLLPCRPLQGQLEVLWGSVSCPRALQHAESRGQDWNWQPFYHWTECQWRWRPTVCCGCVYTSTLLSLPQPARVSSEGASVFLPGHWRLLTASQLPCFCPLPSTENISPKHQFQREKQTFLAGGCHQRVSAVCRESTGVFWSSGIWN